MRRTLIALTLSAALAGPLLADETPPPPDRLAELVRDLGSPVYAHRDAATRELARLGKAALPALEAAARSDDLEVRWRARRVIAEVTAPPVEPNVVDEAVVDAWGPVVDFGRALELDPAQLRPILEEIERVRNR